VRRTPLPSRAVPRRRPHRTTPPVGSLAAGNRPKARPWAAASTWVVQGEVADLLFAALLASPNGRRLCPHQRHCL